jgi:hypothetical protein
MKVAVLVEGISPPFVTVLLLKPCFTPVDISCSCI